jgi:FixJ family two-component response regulator
MGSSQHTYIAVVDDDESACRSFSRLLRAAHFQPITYLSAEAFLADTKHPKFDCLVLDIRLEGMSGLELRRRLAAVNDRTPVVFLTASDEAEMCGQAEAYGCAGFFRKTDSSADLLAAIRRAVGLSAQAERGHDSSAEGHQCPNQIHPVTSCDESGGRGGHGTRSAFTKHCPTD